MQKTLVNQMAEALEALRREKVLAGSVTNTVTMDFVANAQLAAGGAAAMVFMADEAIGLAQVSRAFYINTGTILPCYEETLPQSAAFFHKQAIPWVLDPVGIGMGAIRMPALEAYRAHPPTILRANASEVIALANLWGLDSGQEAGRLLGVESGDSVDQAGAAARALAHHSGGAVMVSGEKDFVTDGESSFEIFGGSPLMEKVTGFGCSLGGVTALYAGVASPLVAACAAAIHYKWAGSQAQNLAKGPASFKVAFLDALDRFEAKNFSDVECKEKER